jgi:hypothetical protein
LFANETYRQIDDYCVLASYGVAMKPFLEGSVRNVMEFFEAYCMEMNLCRSRGVKAAAAEKLYLADFAGKTRKAFSGYALIEMLHEYSDVPPFTRAKAKAALKHFGLPGDAAEVERQLRDANKNVALICVNQQTTIPQGAAPAWQMLSHHSVAVGFEGAEFYMYDTNHGPGLIEIGPNLRIFTRADCLLFTRR